MKKQIFFLALLMLPIVSYADKQKIGGIWYYLIENDKTASVTSGDSHDYSGAIVIPSEVNKGGDTYRVTSIGYYAFRRCSNLTSITIPSSVTSIGIEAFEECSNLTQINIPASVVEIGRCAFRGCTCLSTIQVESGNSVYDSRENCNAIIETATNTLIQGCKNTIIPNDVNIIGQDAFSRCQGLESITIPDGVTQIAMEAFGGCTALTSITIKCPIVPYGFVKGLTSLKEVILGDKVKTIEEWAFSGCTGLTSITIPESVTSIGSVAFYGCSSLSTINIPESITYLGGLSMHNTAWYESQPDGVVYIGSFAYSYKGSLPENTTVKINEGTKIICESAFSSSDGPISIIIPNSVVEIGKNAFYYCNLSTFISEMVNPMLFPDYVFPNNTKTNCKLIIPAGTRSIYVEKGWTANFKEVEEKEDGDPIWLSIVDAERGCTDVKIAVLQNNVVVSGLNEGEIVSVYDIEGHLQTTATSNGSPITLHLAKEQTYIVKAADEIVKVFVK